MTESDPLPAAAFQIDPCPCAVHFDKVGVVGYAVSVLQRKPRMIYMGNVPGSRRGEHRVIVREVCMFALPGLIEQG